MEHAPILTAPALTRRAQRASLRRRIAAVAAFGAVLAAAAFAVVLGRQAAATAARPALPPPHAVEAVVLNGGSSAAARSVAARLRTLSYRVVAAGRASSLGAPRTEVFFPPGGRAICARLAERIGAPVQPLPGGTDPRRCVVVAGPAG